MDFKAIFWRAVKSAVQTFGGMMGAVSMGWLDADAAKAAFVAALCAGISVIWNAIMFWASTPE